MALAQRRLGWRTPVVKTSAANGDGIQHLIDAIQKHREWGAESGEARKRCVEAMRTEVKVLLRARVLQDLERQLDERGLEEVVARVVDKSLDPYGAVDALLGR